MPLQGMARPLDLGRRSMSSEEAGVARQMVRSGSRRLPDTRGPLLEFPNYQCKMSDVTLEDCILCVNKGNKKLLTLLSIPAPNLEN